MNIRKLLTAACLAALALLCLPAGRLSAQSQDGNQNNPLEVAFGVGEQTAGGLPSRRGVVDPVSLQLDQVLAFTLRFPVSKAGQPVILGSPDGGQITSLSSTPGGDDIISAGGTARFSFQAGQTAGLYRVVVQLPGEQHILQFYLVNQP